MPAHSYHSNATSSLRRTRFLGAAVATLVILAGPLSCTKAAEDAIAAVTNRDLDGDWHMTTVDSNVVPANVANSSGTMVHIYTGTVTIYSVDNQFDYSLTFATISGGTLGATRTITRSGSYELCNGGVSASGKNCLSKNGITYSYLFIGNDGGIDLVRELSTGNLSFVEDGPSGQIIEYEYTKTY